MTANERLVKLGTASPVLLAQVDAVLDGHKIRKDQETRLLSISQAARMLGVSRMTIYRLKKCGRLAIVTLPGGTPRITMASVQALAAGETSADATPAAAGM